MILSGYSGLELVYYIMAFMVTIISFSVVITFFYNKSKNILIAMWMHFWFNFLLKIVIIEMYNAKSDGSTTVMRSVYHSYFILHQVIPFLDVCFIDL